ncbi:MAG: Glu/Leu/Phe/Val family dehydrogenase [Alphaproteobacteria bacterium]
MAIQFDYPKLDSYEDFDSHETVLRAEDPEIGFKAYIAVHSTTRGPARGGCRYWPHYATENDAIKDVLRLSRGMTYKTTLADLPFGGGKTVIIGKAGTQNPTPDIMRALGEMLNELDGIYETGEDVGTRTSDFKIAGEVTEHVRVRAVERAGAQDLPGGPPLYTAHGVYFGIKSAAKAKFDTDNLDGIKIAVKGLGNVAEPVCKLLYKDGAKLTVTDIGGHKIGLAQHDMPGIKSVTPDDIIFENVDIYVPCALGGDINDNTIGGIKAAVIAGAANNQLAAPHHAKLLHQRGILYAPDYAINAGGVINVVMIGLNHDEMMARVAVIGKTLDEIFARSQAENCDTARIADMIVQERLAAALELSGKRTVNGH